MCGGGGGDDAQDVADAQYQNELKRQASIKKAVDNINAAFASAPIDQAATRAAVLASPEYAAIQAERERRAGQPKTSTGNALLDFFNGLLGGNADLAMKEQQLYSKYAVQGGREAMYRNAEGAVRGINMRELDRQAGDSRRNLKFNLARAGLSGGSSDVDSQKELARRYNEGTLKVEQLADNAASDLRLSDERTRMSLIGQAQAGLDATQATQLALKNLEANAAAARSVGQYQSLGDLMSDLADYYGVSRYMLGRQEAVNPYGGGFGAAPVSPSRREQGSVTN